jgi:hypothetical protein
LLTPQAACDLAGALEVCGRKNLVRNGYVLPLIESFIVVQDFNGSAKANGFIV